MKQKYKISTQLEKYILSTSHFKNLIEIRCLAGEEKLVRHVNPGRFMR